MDTIYSFLLTLMLFAGPTALRVVHFWIRPHRLGLGSGMSTTACLLAFAAPLALLLVWAVWDIVVTVLYWNVPWNKPGDWPLITGMIHRVVKASPQATAAMCLLIGGLFTHFFLDLD